MRWRVAPRLGLSLPHVCKSAAQLLADQQVAHWVPGSQHRPARRHAKGCLRTRQTLLGERALPKQTGSARAPRYARNPRRSV